jgi:hypothetical protein
MMRKFEHYNTSAGCHEEITIEGDVVKAVYYYFENDEKHFLSGGWQDTLAGMGWSNLKDYLHRLKELNFKEKN